jgi:hypothetical protein
VSFSAKTLVVEEKGDGFVIADRNPVDPTLCSRILLLRL